MAEERIGVISETMLSMFREFGFVDEEWYRGMFDSIAGVIEGFASGMNAVAALDSVPFAEFVHEFEGAYTYDKADELEGFTKGACWAIAGVMEAAADRIERRQGKERDVLSAQNHYGLFREIEQNPGIVQSELARRLGKGKSNLSQILARLEGNGLILSSSQGRFCHYYLSSAGEEALSVAKQAIGEREMREALHNANGGEAGFLGETACYTKAHVATGLPDARLVEVRLWADAPEVRGNANEVSVKNTLQKSYAA